MAEEACNGNLPSGACAQEGYVCKLGFDVDNEVDVMYFHLGLDSTCNSLLSSELKTQHSLMDTTTSASLKVFLIENENNASPLSLTLAGSLALSASNNKERVYIIYRKVSNIEYGGIRLLSISKEK